MTILVVLTTILSLLASSAVPRVNSQGPVNFDYPFFDGTSGTTLNVLYNATIDSTYNILKVTDPSDSWCTTHFCRGQIIYSTAIDFVDRTLQRTYSFSSSFVFSLTIPGTVRSGEGFVFFLIANPYEIQSNGLGDYFGAFPSSGQTVTPTIAVEFDTLKNAEIYDIDDNHVGVDINKAASASQESCYSVNMTLFGGQKIQAWIDYHDSVKTIEVRLAHWTTSVVRPAKPLIDMPLDLTTLADDKMYVGFSGASYSGQEQESAIYSWSFQSKLESPASPPPPRAPTGVISSNSSGPSLPGGNHTARNHTRSKEENIILGLCVGGGLGMLVALAGCFCLGLYCSKNSAEAANADEDRRKSSKAAGYEGNTEEDDQSKKYDEGKVVSDDVEAGTFGAGILGPQLIRARSFKSIPPREVNDPTPTALRRGRTMPRKAKSARELEAEGVQADAIKKGILDTAGTGPSEHAWYRRRSQSGLSSFGDDESADTGAKRRKTWSPTKAITGRELMPLPEEEIRADYPVPASPEVGTGVSPEKSQGKALVPRTAAVPAPEVSGDGRGLGDDAGPGTSDTVYQIPSRRSSSSVENAAKRSNYWNLWSSGAGTAPQGQRQSSPVGRTAFVSSVQVEGTKSWSSDRTREVQVVLKRGEPILHRRTEATSPERSQVSSSQRSQLGSPQHTSTPAGTIMFTNTLYDSSPEESRERPPHPDNDLSTDDNTYLHHTAENIYDRPPVATNYGEEIVERIFDLEITKEEDDVDRLFDGQHRGVRITSADPNPEHTPAQRRGGRRSPSESASPKISPAGTTTPSTAETSRSSSTDASKDSQRGRVKQRPHWKY